MNNNNVVYMQPVVGAASGMAICSNKNCRKMFNPLIGNLPHTKEGFCNRKCALDVHLDTYDELELKNKINLPFQMVHCLFRGYGRLIIPLKNEGGVRVWLMYSKTHKAFRKTSKHGFHNISNTGVS